MWTNLCSILDVSQSFSRPLESDSNTKTQGAQIVYNNKPFNRNHIVYIKTHKAASSTIQSMLMRYGMRNNLTFAIPPRNKQRQVNQLGFPARFNHIKHMSSEIEKPDILCYHSVLSTDLINTMPMDSFYLTSLRDPFSQIKSAYVYYNVGGPRRKPLMSFLKAAKSRQELNNPQSYDLGLSVTHSTTEAAIMEGLTAIDSLFHFVIIVEYFEECLILLRDMMKWTNDDILYFRVNFNGKSQKTASASPKENPQLPSDTPENRQIVYKYLHADYIIYSFFKLKVEKIIEQNRDYLDTEIAKLHELQSTWSNFCLESSAPSSKIKDSRFRTYGVGSYGYILKKQGYLNQTCIELACAELHHTKLLADYQARLLSLRL